MAEVTVILTVYNGMPYLPRAIESILNQTLTDFEFLIVNDCSTDNSREVILSHKDSRIRLVDNPVNMKQTQSMNLALKSVKTEFVGRMDADDVSHPHRLELQLEFLKAHPDVAAVGTNINFIDEDDRVVDSLRRPLQDQALRWMQFFDNPVSCGIMMFRTMIVRDELGGFAPFISVAQDWELWSRMPKTYRLANLPGFLYDVRRHSGSSTIEPSPRVEGEIHWINRANIRRILNITDESEAWLKKVDDLLLKRIDRPEERVAVISILFHHFCSYYPNAVEDPDVLDILAREYLGAVYYAPLSCVPRAIRSLRRDRHKAMPAGKLLRQLVRMLGNEGPSHFRHWCRRNLLTTTR